MQLSLGAPLSVYRSFVSGTLECIINGLQSFFFSKKMLHFYNLIIDSPFNFLEIELLLSRDYFLKL